MAKLRTLLSAQADVTASQLAKRAHALGRRIDKRSVHALRVAARRARSLLWTMKPWLRKGTSEPTVKRLKSITSLLGPMRDLDVLAEVLPTQIARKVRLTPAQARQLCNDLAIWRARTHRFLYAAIRSAAFQASLRTVQECMVSSSLLRKDGPSAIAPWIRRIERDAARLRRHARHAQKKDLHRIRRRAKRCRYALEALGTDAPQKSRRRMKHLQTSLGEYCDMRVAAAWLSKVDSLRDQVLRRKLLRVAESIEKRLAKGALKKLHQGLNA